MSHVSMIVSTYNNPLALRQTLWALFEQSYKDFEIVIADDGSDETTRTVIQDMARLSPVKIKHIWHPDTGFTKTKILNKALVVCAGERIIVTDGDCVCRGDFIAPQPQGGKARAFCLGKLFQTSKRRL